ncbi:hypothetical protein BH09ACT10_BH09ACT10_07230 [soil metagenome]
MSGPTADVSARLAWAADAEMIAALQIKAWRHAYADVLTADQLAGLDASAFADEWRATIERPRDARSRVLVALERVDMRGFALVHPSTDPDGDPIADAEIGEFVVDPDRRGAGHGSRLLSAAVDTMRSDRFTRAQWWIGTEDDRLREFIASTGWHTDGAHRELMGESGERLKQIRLHTDLSGADG